MPKNSQNAFSFFLKEYCENNSSRGCRITMQQAAIAAGPLWKELNPIERSKYEALAQKGKQGRVKYDNENIPIYIREKELQEQQEFHFNMLEEIEMTVSSADAIDDQIFHIIHINIFCYVDSLKKYFPAEFSISRFNLKNGIENMDQDVLHALCVPDKIPLGYKYTVDKTSADTHQIPFPVGKNTNLGDVFQSVLNFLSQDIESAGSLPPVYALPKNAPIVRDIMSDLCNRFGHRKTLIRVYELHHLFLNLCNNAYKHAGHEIVYQTISNAVLELEKDVYDFAPGICCDFHKECDVPIHCSKSVVIRNAYILCDNCCTPLRIKLIPGQHIPLQADICRYIDLPAKHDLQKVVKVKNPIPSIGGPGEELIFENDYKLDVSGLSISDNELCNDNSHMSIDQTTQELKFASLSQTSSTTSSQTNIVDNNEAWFDSRSWKNISSRGKLRRPNTPSAALDQRITKNIFPEISLSSHSLSNIPLSKNSQISNSASSGFDFQQDKMSYESLRDRTPN